MFVAVICAHCPKAERGNYAGCAKETIMKIIAESLELDPDIVAFSDWKFKSYKRPDDKIYQIIDTHQNFIDKFQKIYDEDIKWQKQENERHNEFDPPWDGCVEYPTLTAALFENGEEGREFIRYYYDTEILKLYITWDDQDEEHKKWNVESVDELRIDGENIIFSGKINNFRKN
jgi:hypothetical protein